MKEGFGLFSFMKASDGEHVTSRQKCEHRLEREEQLWDALGDITFRKWRAKHGLSLTMDKPK